MNFTEEDKTRLNKLIKEQEAGEFIIEFKRLRQEKYSNMSIEQKISAAELGYNFARLDGQIIFMEKNLLSVINLIIEKINTRYCS